MVSALVNGVKGGKWYSLVDKVIRPTTLDAAWHKVARNQGAAGVDGQSVLDGFERRRLRPILRQPEKRPGIGRCNADHQRWPNAFFAAGGLFTLHAASAPARRSR